ncbi:hypothetical protein BaRGS_00013213 [Batillaria attramentaria]|uniref:Sushi domain-containing protein n=1 Tax=Batillaria attramentaria TaxID=370345 RepID=A0ABD0L856_9CAEN
MGDWKMADGIMLIRLVTLALTLSTAGATVDVTTILQTSLTATTTQGHGEITSTPPLALDTTTATPPLASATSTTATPPQASATSTTTPPPLASATSTTTIPPLASATSTTTTPPLASATSTTTPTATGLPTSPLPTWVDLSITSSNSSVSFNSTDDNITMVMPSSVTMPFSAVVTSPPTTTTTTLDPIESLKCNGEFPPPGGNSSYRLLVLRLVEYTCNHGYKRSGGQTLMECKRKGWDNGRTDRILQCHALEPDPVIKRVPEELVTSLIVVGVLLVVVAIGLALFTALLRSSLGMTYGRTLPWQQTTKPPAFAKGGHSRRWPWKRPPRPRYPPGHVGLDGVAWVVDADTVAHPVKL